MALFRKKLMSNPKLVIAKLVRSLFGQMYAEQMTSRTNVSAPEFLLGFRK